MVMVNIVVLIAVSVIGGRMVMVVIDNDDRCCGSSMVMAMIV